MVYQNISPSFTAALLFFKRSYINGQCTDGVRGPDIDRIFVFWSPEACIADSMADDGLSKVVSGNTQVSILCPIHTADADATRVGVASASAVCIGH